jgi:hypothetical protein
VVQTKHALQQGHCPGGSRCSAATGWVSAPLWHAPPPQAKSKQAEARVAAAASPLRLTKARQHARKYTSVSGTVAPRPWHTSTRKRTPKCVAAPATRCGYAPLHGLPQRAQGVPGRLQALTRGRPRVCGRNHAGRTHSTSRLETAGPNSTAAWSPLLQCHGEAAGAAIGSGAPCASSL